MSGITSIPHCGELEDGAGERGPRDPSSGGLNDVIRGNVLMHVVCACLQTEEALLIMFWSEGVAQERHMGGVINETFSRISK